MCKLNLIYVASGDVSVYESQVLELLIYLQRCDINITLLQGYVNKKGQELLKKKLFAYPSINVIWVKSYPTYPIFERQQAHNFYIALQKIKNWHNAVIHVRSEYIGFIFKIIATNYHIKNPILIDIRGVGYEEIKFKIKHLSGIRQWLLILQKYYYHYFYQKLFRKDKSSIFITSVSSSINHYFQQKYLHCKYPFFVHPNIAGVKFSFSHEKRKELRVKYKLLDHELLAVCSTGGNATWQQDHLIIQKLLDIGIKVINLSKKNFGILGCITKIVPFNEVPDILSAADIAILWREDSFVNQSASPAKFSEFISMGLFVLHNKSVKIATDYIAETGAGCVVDRVNDISMKTFSPITPSDRKERCTKGQNTFGVENIGKSYHNTYKMMLSSKNRL